MERRRAAPIKKMPVRDAGPMSKCATLTSNPAVAQPKLTGPAAGYCIERRAGGFTIGTVARSAKNSAWNEVFAIILLLTGTLLFFALISYSPRDLPSWVPWSYLSPPNRPAQNFIGPFGAIFASVFYLLIGAASYFLAAVLLGFGAAKLFYPRLRVIARLPWIVLFIVSGACLLAIANALLL